MSNELNETQIDAVLHHNVIGHLGCCIGHQPYVVPMCYAYDGTNIYGRTYEGLKLNSLRKNPDICFQVEEIETMTNWKTVVCMGTFNVLADEAAQKAAILVLQQRISAMIESEALRQSLYWPFSLKEGNGFKGVLFCISIASKTGRFHSDSLGGGEGLFI